jgi:hypothetical protein
MATASPRDPDGLPDFRYVATHICDSIKRRLKADGAGSDIQGEFGIGLLSFWTVGDTLTMTSTGADQRAYQMVMSKGDPRYTVSPRRVLFAERGTEVKISPLLEGIRGLSGEKIQWYLASELRDRIRNTQVRVTVIDKLAQAVRGRAAAVWRPAACYRQSARHSARRMPNYILRNRPTSAGSPLPGVARE